MGQLREMLGCNVHWGVASTGFASSAEAAMHYVSQDQIWSYWSGTAEALVGAATVVSVAPSGNVFIDAVVAGYRRWFGQVIYSFPSNVSAFGSPATYATSVDGFQQVSAAQIAAVQRILEGSGNSYCSEQKQPVRGSLEHRDDGAVFAIELVATCQYPPPKSDGHR
jgi:hypothetical protein